MKDPPKKEPVVNDPPKKDPVVKDPPKNDPGVKDPDEKDADFNAPGFIQWSNEQRLLELGDHGLLEKKDLNRDLSTRIFP